MKYGLILAAGVALAIGLSLRGDHPGIRPLHNDEAVNAIKLRELDRTGSFLYDPLEYHGPALFYFSEWIGKACRAPDLNLFTEARLRWVTILFGAAMIPLVALLRDGLGRQATGWSMLFFAVSPSFVFYSRYYIHEILLACFSLMTIGAAWKYWRMRQAGWAALTGIGLGLMHATKETFILSLAVGVLSLAVNHFWNRRLDASGVPILAPRLSLKHLSFGFLAAAVTSVLFFSAFGTHWKGVADSFKAFGNYGARGAGQHTAHLHPWYYYYHHLLFFHAGKGVTWSEGIILVLGIVAGLAGFFRRGLAGVHGSLIRFLFLDSILLSVVYGIIPYKTPWCLLQFWLVMILLAGVGAAILVRIARYQWARLAAGILIGLSALQLMAQAWQATHAFENDSRNPFVYSPTHPNLLELVERIDQLAEVTGAGKQLAIKVLAREGDYWPLPWYLRCYEHVGWYGSVPANPYSEVMIVSKSFEAALDEAKTHVMIGYYQLRTGEFLECYVELKLWNKFLEKQTTQSSADQNKSGGYHPMATHL